MSGKIKTAVSIVAICIMLTPLHIKSAITIVDTVCYTIMTIVTLWSGAEYFIKNRKILNFRK
jgi:CDP-diacylglycerol--glycerol-3-phosphate 3-phosphatidyltransferase